MPPPYVLNDNDVVEFTLIGDYQQSTILNVWHYVYKQGAITPDPDAYMAAALTALKTKLWSTAGALKSILCNEYTLERTRIQVVYPTRRYYLGEFVGEQASVLGGGIPSDTHIEVAMRTAVVGRGLTGNKKITGLPVASLQGATFANVTQASVDTWAATLKDVISPLLGFIDSTLTPIVWSSRPPRADNRRVVIDCESRPEVRVEPSRRLGRGI